MRTMTVMPSGLAERRVFGHCGPWISGHNQAAMCRLPAGQPLLAVNDRLLVQATAGPDPQETDDVFIGNGGFLITNLPATRP